MSYLTYYLFPYRRDKQLAKIQGKVRVSVAKKRVGRLLQAGRLIAKVRVVVVM